MSSFLLSHLEVVCSHCSKLSPPLSKACQHCGAPLDALQAPPGLKTKTRTSGEIPPPMPSGGGQLTAPYPAVTPSVPVLHPAVPPVVEKKPGPKLKIERAGLSIGELTVSSDALTIGRASVDALSSDVFISPQHAVLRLAGEQLTIEDLNSVSGVYLSGGTTETVSIGEEFVLQGRYFKYRGAVSIPPRAAGVLSYGSPLPNNANIVYIIDEILEGGRTGQGFVISTATAFVGGERGDIPLAAGIAPKSVELIPSQSALLLKSIAPGIISVKAKGPKALDPNTTVLIGRTSLKLVA